MSSKNERLSKDKPPRGHFREPHDPDDLRHLLLHAKEYGLSDDDNARVKRMLRTVGKSESRSSITTEYAMRDGYLSAVSEESLQHMSEKLLNCDQHSVQRQMGQSCA